MPVLEDTETRTAGPYTVTLETLGLIQSDEARTDPILFPFQERAVARIAGKEEALIFSSSGLERESTAIAAAAKALESGSERVIVLTRSMLTTFWAGLLRERFGIAETDVLVVQGDECERDAAYLNSKAHWVIVSYSMLIRDTVMLRRLSANAYLVIDSVYEIENMQSQRAVATRELASIAPRRLGLLSPSGVRSLPELLGVVGLILDPKKEKQNAIHDTVLALTGGRRGDCFVHTVA